MIKLTKREKLARETLIKVAKGELKTHKNGLISYKEFWSVTTFFTTAIGKMVLGMAKVYLINVKVPNLLEPGIMILKMEFSHLLRAMGLKVFTFFDKGTMKVATKYEKEKPCKISLVIGIQMI